MPPFSSFLVFPPESSSPRASGTFPNNAVFELTALPVGITPHVAPDSLEGNLGVTSKSMSTEVALFTPKPAHGARLDL